MLSNSKKDNVSLYKSRREVLLDFLQQENNDASGIFLLFAGFERETEVFRQESSFFYLTGINEPGVVMVCDLDGSSTLYAPNCSLERTKWMDIEIPLVPKNSEALGVDAVKELGDPCYGYSLHPFFEPGNYKVLIKKLEAVIKSGGKIFTLNPDNPREYVEQRLILERLKSMIPDFQKALVDVSSLIAGMRRKKDMQEIERMYDAMNITIMAHEAAAEAIEPEASEREVQGALEYIFTAAGGRAAFPSVVAGGKNGTILHYTSNMGQLKKGDLVVVDVGAQMNHYCADLTRTYPVSGTFTDRQRELYNAVLETQQFVAEEARPGMWLMNDEQEDKSLHHLAKRFLRAKGLEKYFSHGIGHFLGMDVHDVGSFSRPLQEGDVFTIEPGIYIPEEGIGIRIEDNFWMVKDSAICLSEDLPRDPDAIEKFMKQSDEESSDCSSDDDLDIQH